MTEQVSPVAPAEPKKKGGAIFKIIAAIVGIVIVVAVVAIVRFGITGIKDFISGGNTTRAKIGDCITQAPDPNDMKIVECAKPEAAYKVAGVVDNKTQAEAETSCAAFPSAQSYLFQWEGAEQATAETKGQVLCLEPNQK